MLVTPIDSDLLGNGSQQESADHLLLIKIGHQLSLGKEGELCKANSRCPHSPLCIRFAPEKKKQGLKTAD